MQFFLAILVWLLIGLLFGIGIWLAAVKGIVSVLAVLSVVFILAVWKIGCQAH